MAQGLCTPDPSLSPTHLSVRRGRTTTTHYTHNQVSLMVSCNNTFYLFYPLWDAKMSISFRAMVGVVSGSLADSQPKSSGLVLGRRPLGAVLHSSNEPGELSQWLCHDDSTINIVLDIIIILLLHNTWLLGQCSSKTLDLINVVTLH